MQQYWAGDPDVYQFIGVAQLAEAFAASGIGSETRGEDDLEKGSRKLEGMGSVNGRQEDVEKGNKGQRADQHKQDQELEPLVHTK